MVVYTNNKSLNCVNKQNKSTEKQLSVPSLSINCFAIAKYLKVFVRLFSKRRWGRGAKPPSQSADCEILILKKAQEGRKIVRWTIFRRGTLAGGSLDIFSFYAYASLITPAFSKIKKHGKTAFRAVSKILFLLFIKIRNKLMQKFP